jgi:hypothetical protein
MPTHPYVRTLALRDSSTNPVLIHELQTDRAYLVCRHGRHVVTTALVCAILPIMRKRVVVAVAGLGVLAALAGTVAVAANQPAQGETYAALNRAQDAGDGLPVLMRPEDATFDVGSLRKVGDLDDLAYFVASDKTTGNACLIAFSPSDSVFMDCDDNPGLSSSPWGERAVRLVIDGAEVPVGWDTLGPNVIFEAE